VIGKLTLAAFRFPGADFVETFPQFCFGQRQ
jgi:hypothetical protein